MAGSDLEKKETFIQKREASYENHSDKFKFKTKVYTRQYAHIYNVRLQRMRKILEETSKKKWGSDVPIKQIYQLTGKQENIVVIGTLFKIQELKPCIIKELSDKHHIMKQPIRTKYVQPNDKVIMEDELQRLVLIGGFSAQQVVTGIVAAVYGSERDGGKFFVKEYAFASTCEQIPRPKITEDKFVCLVSGLELNSLTADGHFSTNLMMETMGGHSRALPDQAKVVRVLIAGNSVDKSCQLKEMGKMPKYVLIKTKPPTVEGMKILDDLMSKLSENVPVDLMPGENDPTNYMIPQQAFNPCLFPRSRRNKLFRSVTNPHEADIDGVRFLGCSGQNVDDVRRYSELESGAEILEKLLTWRHIMPTAPDTLPCYPYYDDDPFIPTACPHIFFVGNQESFETKLFQDEEGRQVRLVSVPRFATTNTCVLVNLRTLECSSFTFSPKSEEESMEQ